MDDNTITTAKIKRAQIAKFSGIISKRGETLDSRGFPVLRSPANTRDEG